MADYKQDWDTDEERQSYEALSLDFDQTISPQMREEEEELARPESLDKTWGDRYDDVGNVLKSITPTSFFSALLEGKGYQGAKDQAKWDYNKYVAQEVRDTFGVDDKVQNQGAWYQPDTVVDPETGVVQRTGNKHFNDYTDQELDYLKQEYLKEKGGETYYEMFNPDSNLEKSGYSSERHGIYDRYKNDPNFEDWVVTKNTKTKNASLVERIEHGQRNNLDARLISKENYDDYEGLVAGRTEVYKSPTHALFDTPTAKPSRDVIFGEETTGSAPTNVQARATIEADAIMDERQKRTAQRVKDNALSKTTDDVTKMNRQDFYKNVAKVETSEDLAKMVKARSQHIDGEKGILELNEGTMTDDVLATLPAWQKLAEDLDGRVTNLSSGEVKQRKDGTTYTTETTSLQKAQNLIKFMSETGWNLTTLLARGIDVADNPELAGKLADAMEIYDSTKTDAGQVVRGIGNMLKDPSNAVGMAASNIGKLVGAKAMSEGPVAILRSIAKRAVQNPKGMAATAIKSPTSTTAVTGGAMTGVDDATRQGIAVEGGRQSEFDFERSGKAMGMGVLAGGALAQATKLFGGKTGDILPKTSVDEFDTMIQQTIKKSQGKDLPRAERTFLRKEVQRMRKFREGLSARKENVEAKAEFKKNQELFEKMKAEIAREASDPKNHPYVAKFYGLEEFEKSAQPSVLTEKNAGQEMAEVDAKNKEIDTDIDAEQSKIETPNNEKPIQEDESIEATKFSDKENITTEVRQPQDMGEDIGGGTTKTAPNKQKEVVVEERGASKRGYQEDGYLQSHQQGITGFSQTRVKEGKYDNKSVDATDDYITAKMKAFQEKEEMVKTYGQNTAKEGRDRTSGGLKPKKDYTPEEKLGRRASYELNEIGKAMAKRGISDEVKASLKDRASALIKHVQSVRKPGVMTKRLQQEVDKFYEDQFKPMKEYDNKTRADEIGEQYRFLKDAATKEEKIVINGKKEINPDFSEWSRRQEYSPYNAKKVDGKYVPTTVAEKNKFIRQVYKKMDSEHRKLGKKVGQLEDRVRKQLLAKGIQDDLAVLPKKGVDMDAVKQIQRYRDLSDDLNDFKSKKIKHEELLYRETERMDSDIKDRVAQEKKKGDLSTDEALMKVAEDYDKLGLTTRPESEMKSKGSYPVARLTKVSDGKYRYGQYGIEKAPNGSYNVVKSDGGKSNFPNRKSAVAEAQRRIDWVNEQKRPEIENAKASKEAAENAKIRDSHDRQTKKFEAFVGRNNTQRRRTAANQANIAKETVTQLQEELLNAGVRPEQLADMQFPREATNESLPFWKKYHKKSVYTELNEKSRDRLGTPSVRRFRESPASLSFEGTMIDASNSMLQMMAILTGNVEFAKYSKLTGGKLDARKVVGDEMSKHMDLPDKPNVDGEKGSWKDFVKPLFMTENYGQGKIGLIRTLQNEFDFEPDLAQKFYDEYRKAMEKEFPAIGVFKNIINERMKYPEMGKDIHWTMPDGDRITLTIEKEANGKYSIRSNDVDFTEFTGDLDTVSSSLMPSYIQSYDAWIAKRMRQKGYLTNHDAFIPEDKSKTELDMQKDYGEILAEVLDSDSLNKNLKEMMPETKLGDGTTSITPSIKKGQLTKDDIMNSPHKMEVEHSADKGNQDAKARKIENEKWKTDEELMRDFMASSNMRNIDTHSLTDSIIDNIGRNSEYAKVTKNQDVFERQASLATASAKYDPSKAIPAPKGVDKAVWDATQRNIFYESRAKMEQNPNAREILEGDRMFFQENGKPVGDTTLTRKEVEQMFRLEDFKNRQEYNQNIKEESKRINERNKQIQQNIIALENQKGKAIYSNFKPAEKKLARRIGKTYIQMARRAKSWSPNKLLNEAESFAKEVVAEARSADPSNAKVNNAIDKKKIQKWTAYYIRQVQEGKPEYKQLQELNNLAKKFGNDSARFKEGLQKNLRRNIPEAEREEWTKALLNTDYAAIDGMTKKIADEFMEAYKDDYKTLKKWIDAAADGLNTPEKQVGFYRNNPQVIAREAKMTEDMIPIIDQMISIKAMTPEAWKFVESRKNDANFIKTMERIKYNQEISRDVLFANNPESIIKGYTEQVTNSNFTLNEKGEKIYKTDSFSRGLADVEVENKKRGKEIGELTNPELRKKIRDTFENIKRIEKEIASTPRERQELRMRSLYDSIEFVKKNKNNERFADIIPGIEKSIYLEKEKMKSNKMSEPAINRRIDNAGPRSQEEIEVMKRSSFDKKVLRAGLERLNKQTGGALDLNRPINDVNSFIADKRNIKLSQKDVRKVAGEEVREELGRSHDITEILAETIGNTEIKMGRRKKIEQMKQSTFDELYSKEERDGFVKLTDDEIRTLPRDLRDDMVYVREKFHTQIMGREDVSLSKNASQGWKVVDRLVRDATTRFKKNNVLSNSASHVNALMYNQVIAPSIGINPKNQAKYQMQAMRDMQEITELYQTISDKHSRGKPIDAEMAKLQENELYLMEQEGLSTNTIDGISQEPDLWRQIVSDATSSVEKKLGTKFDKTRNFTNNLFAEGDSWVGQKFNASFTAIDTSGRYMATKHYMSPEGGNLSRVEATRKANGLFGDMDQIAPEIIDFLDKYPAMPFMKWWTSVAPGTAKMFKENPIKAITAAMVTYYAMRGSEDENSYGASGVRTTGWNPLFGNIDFPESMTVGQYDDWKNDINRDTSWGEKIGRRVSKYVMPSYMTKPYWKYQTESQKKDPDYSKLATGFIYSNADANYKNIKGAPLELEGISDEAMRWSEEWFNR